MKHILKVTTVAMAAGALLLSACGTGTTGQSGTGEGGAPLQIKATDYLKVDYADLKDGGTLTLPVSQVTDQMNSFHADSTNDTSVIWSWYNPQIALFDDQGEWYPNPAYITEWKDEVVDGKTQVTFTVNDKAKWNDGTPIDWTAFEATWKVSNGKDAANFPANNTGGYQQIESITKGDKDNVVVVKFDRVFPWWKQTFETLYHPKAVDPEIFQNGYIKNAHGEWGAGPYKLENIDFNGGSVTFVPNENWWGDKPKLERVTLVAKDDQAEVAAFKNKEIDMIAVGNADRLAQVADLTDITKYTAPSLSLALIQLNADSEVMKDKEVRSAFFHAIDRETLFKIRFQGIDFKEDPVGSNLVRPSQKSYQDNLGELGKFDPEKAKSMLEAAGWTQAEGQEYRTKDGKTLEVLIPNFSTNPLLKNMYGAIQSMLKNVGIKLNIDQRSAADFQKTMADKSFDLVLSGLTLSNPFGMGDLGQVYRSDSELSKTGLGSAELDKKIEEAEHQPTEAEAVEAGNKVEAEALAQAGWLPIYNGPVIVATRNGLANIGAMGFTKIAHEYIGWKK
ncbi:ABC transporter family substrate-binding protein [Boudabousia marimammalium]|uniref:Solute-binding protein family 5 domain-containing protein n=1 Tax=Boudabousia marimammalium TaxID=156892 RepID=A0A1Q5PRN4_9ACTO|nr:ABC transporter family substrate-binding protein [Boudabousia marimammalium]OKL50247.1 hypothetical protein BM477_02320 [Boudabousia marimammalium]